MLRTVVDIIGRLAAAAGNGLWPLRCALCGQSGHEDLDLCAGCAADLPRNDHACEHCAEPLADNHSSIALCGRCLQRAPDFDACVAPFRYEFPVDRMIQGLKYRRELVYGRVLGELLARHLCRRETRPELVIPVPLGLARYRERGFNQARELALPVCKSLGLALRSDLITRRRETQEQASLDRNERLKNTRRAFALTAPLQARHVAIVDDVVTTGSTVNEISKVLRAAGVEWIEVWAVARAERSR
ncbi:ComF family protein [Steroidobacter cummioxidans]|uniref:ComF family protein n=1 Tax=Steroidobacter cummioxidans TaxID=1803913 RepID=UPI000E31C303|nr:ComF family protein [Steroidobacter cummioxidans]